MWDRLSPEAAAVMNLARDEAQRLGQSYIGVEHVLIGLLGHGQGAAARLLAEAGLDVAGARAELRRLHEQGLTPSRRTDDVAALRAVGIDVEDVRARLAAQFGADAVGRAVRRASRRPWWRGGGRRRTPLCGPALFAKRALAYAAEYADACGSTPVTPEHLLAGVLQDMTVPADVGLGRRGRRHLAQLGWTLGLAHPARSMLDAHGVDPERLRAALASDRSG